MVYLGGDCYMTYNVLKPVHVHEYTRVRFGRLEYVCEHWRSLPSR